MTTIYFDSAATTLKKPPTVREAMYRAVGEMTSPGRGGHGAAMRASDMAYACREEIAALFRVPNPEHVVFTANATHGLNMAMKSAVSRGDRVVISGYEHNSVTRPLFAMGAKIAIAKGKLFDPVAVFEDFRREIAMGAKLVVCNHVSNVFGFVLPMQEIAALCHARKIPLMIDASQSAGVIEIDAAALGADFIAMPGHKSLYGPQGIGVLLCRESPKRTLLEGGTGSDSLHVAMPEHLPDRLEVGTPNMPGIAGLLAGIRFVKKQGISNISRHGQTLHRRLIRALEPIEGIHLYTASRAEDQTAVLSLRVEGVDCEELGAKLSEMGVMTRAGLHCAPLAHQSAGTLETGTLRLSICKFNTPQEVDRCKRIIAHVVNKLKKNEKTS